MEDEDAARRESGDAVVDERLARRHHRLGEIVSFSVLFLKTRMVEDFGD